MKDVPVRTSGRSVRPRRSRLGVRLLLLGVAALVAVWTGHGVTWEALVRFATLWLFERLGVVALAVAVVAALWRKWWLAVSVVVVSLVLIH